MELVMPINYEVLEQEQMMYLDGGLYINDSTVQGIAFAIGAMGYMSIASIARIIKIKSTIFSLKLAAFSKTLAIFGAAYVAANIGNIAPAFASALVRRKGLDIGIDW
ncbi:hypothetical protein ERUR111494_02875 [Erysipelothrix urinaevulpis]|uniref:hypothetical protein n=1 Tax=Erysipelothrix urinaevulpis TaxID=2683717 RepID=UPI0013586DAD|nr:hypothetical protein [Erysipelothrix urinaevulpis]